jgi:hypothetical protein
LEAGNSSLESKRIAGVVTSAAKEANNKNFVAGFRDALLFEAAILAAITILSFSLPRHIKLSADMG